MKETISLNTSNIQINYSKFLEYLKEKKAYDHREDMEFLLRGKYETEIISFLVSLEQARKIWKNAEGKPLNETYGKAINFLLSKWSIYFQNKEGEYIVDPSTILKGIFNKYDGFIRQEKKIKKQENQKRILDTLLEEFRNNTPLYQAPIAEIEKIKKNIKSLSPATKKVIQNFGLKYIVNLIYSYKMVEEQLINKTIIPEDTSREYNDIDDLYRREIYEKRNINILSFENNFIKQFKKLIDEKHKLNNNQIKEIIKEIDSYIQLENEEKRKEREKIEETERNKEIKKEIETLEKQFNEENYGDPELWTRITELKDLL